MNSSLRRVAVYCGARLGNSPAYAQAAAELAHCLAQHGIGIVYGGSRNGLMNIVANAALAAGGEVIGVIPTLFQKQEQAHQQLSKLILVSDIHERKAKMLELADAVIALPGGGGTLDELAEAFAWANMGIHTKPCLCFDVNNFWQPLFDLVERMQQEGFMNKSTLLRASTPLTAVEQLKNTLS